MGTQGRLKTCRMWEQEFTRPYSLPLLKTRYEIWTLVDFDSSHRV